MSILDQSLGQLARDIPGITAVFHKYQLDFCCGGKQSLRAAADQRNVDIDTLLKELESVQSAAMSEQSWTGVPDSRLIEHIVSRYHDVHRRQLPELIRLARRVEQVHAGRFACPAGLAVHLERLHAELENHMQKEERMLFPLIVQELHSMTTGPITVMRREHDDHGAALAVIDSLTEGITPPAGACNTWRALYLGLETFKTDLMNHIHLENNILFDRIDKQLEGVKHG
ncbi:MAG TPA: iron-sulfur cluster repair protein YtfE [Gammaproteobacteria bacterium]|jgi:regulator of cell morphogenesis and NO signaling